MKILVVGGTGTIGRMLIPYLQGLGIEITVGTRDRLKAQRLLGADVKLMELSQPDSDWMEVFREVDGVINLAGSPLVAGRWNKRRKSDFVSSRVGIAQWISDHILASQEPPGILISASAVGFYGDRGEEVLEEQDPGGFGFLANLCSLWEHAARNSASLKTRVCVLRLGVVLTREGGHLAKMCTPPLSLFAIVPGDGKQMFPWIHIIDLVRIIETCLRDPRMIGPINCTAPESVTAKQFALELRSTQPSKFLLPIPSMLLAALLGDGRELVTFSQNVVPKRLSDTGFHFLYDSLSYALNEECGQEELASANSGSDFVTVDQIRDEKDRVTKGHYELRSLVRLSSPATSVFSFFSSPLNLGLVTPGWVGLEIINLSSTIESGTEISYRLRFWLFKLHWKCKIILWDPEKRFIDTQGGGAHGLWRHQHRVFPIGSGTAYVDDKVVYSLPFGLVGRCIHRIFLKKALIRIFNYRRKVITIKFSQLNR